MSYTNHECEKGSSRRRRVSGRRGATWDPCPCTFPWPCLLLGILALTLLLGLLLLLALHALTALLATLRVRVLDAGLVGPHALFAGFESEAVGLRGALLFAVRFLAALLAAPALLDAG